MLGILLLIGFLLSGIIIADGLFHEEYAVKRLWLGLTIGLMLMMWLPSLFAFFMGFTKAAQPFALEVAALGAVAAHLPRKRTPRPANLATREAPLWLVLALVVPMTALSGYLQYTHTLMVAADGALMAGQSTFGDLCLHLGIATGLQNASFPPDYTILAGTQLGYPFLADAMAASMLLYGTDLAASFVITGTLMMALVYLGFVLFAWEMVRRPMAVALAFCLLFFNGGLGFAYSLDKVFQDPSRLKSVFTGFYAAPANLPDLNIRWVNVVCDMMIPQRTLLAGWTALLPALYLLARAMREKRTKLFVILGAWAGLMPMIHTHSFLALGLLSAGIMGASLVQTKGPERRAALVNFLAYGGVAVALALPQLILWTFPQTVGNGTVKVWLNWVNNTGSGLIDGYFWFWIKNVGPVYLLMLPAALSVKGRGRAFAVGALTIYAAAELFVFQPNHYDNNKLFYVAFLVMLPLAGGYLEMLWRRLKGLKCRALFLAAFLAVSTLSGGMSLGREAISEYELFTKEEAGAGEFARLYTDQSSVFLTGQQHNNPIAALGGRHIVCGTGSYLFFHGIDASKQAQAQADMLERPSESAALFEVYAVDYVYVSSYERGSYAVDEDWFMENCALVYDEGDVRIFAMAIGEPIDEDASGQM